MYVPYDFFNLIFTSHNHSCIHVCLYVYRSINYIWHILNTHPPTASVLIFINSAFQSLLLIFSALFFSFPFPLQEFSSLFITEIPWWHFWVAHSRWLLISHMLLVAKLSHSDQKIAASIAWNLASSPSLLYSVHTKSFLSGIPFFLGGKTFYSILV